MKPSPKFFPRIRPPRGRAGFSLLEMLVSTVLLMAVMTALGTTMVVQQRDYISQRYWRRADEAARSALAVVETAVRNAGANPRQIATLFTSLTPPGSLHPNPLAAGQWNNVQVRADFNPTDGDVLDLYEDVRVWAANDTMFVRWIAGGAAEPVAMPVRTLAFQYFRHDGSQVTTLGTIGEATRVRVTVTAPVGLTGTRTLRRSGWVYLRNRT